MNAENVRGLVLSMEPNEKRLFRAAAGEKKYGMLFDLLNSGKEMKLDGMATRLGIGQAALRKQIDYLFEAIMHFIDRREGPDAQRLLRWARLLHARGQTETALGLSARARRAAENLDEQGTLLETLEWELGLIHDPMARNSLNASHREVSGSLMRTLELKALAARLVMAPKGMNADNAILLASIRKDPALGSREGLSPRGLAAWLKCWRLIHTLTGEDAPAAEISGELIRHMRNAPGAATESETIDEMAALPQLLIRMGHDSEARAQMMRLGAFEASTPELRAKVFLLASTTLLAQAIDSLDIDAGRVLLADSATRWDSLEGYRDTSKLELLAFNAVRFCLVAGDHAACTRWASRFHMAYVPGGTKAPLRVWVRIHEAICRVGLGDFQWGMDSVADGIRRQAKADAIAYRLPLFAARVAASIARKGMPTRAEFRAWADEAESLKADPFERRAFDLFVPFDAWLEGMYKKLAVLEVLKSRLEKGSAGTSQGKTAGA